MANPPVPDTRPHMGELTQQLEQLLANLTESDWGQPTICPGWTVKDIAAHLLDTGLRRLSFHRDGMPMPEPESPVNSYADLVAMLNRLNADWVKAAKRLSPRVLTHWLIWTQHEVLDFVETLDMDGPAFFPVAWAGEVTSTCRFDVAREYTEWWIHQAQIREAIGARQLDSPEFYGPLLATLMQALPHHYRETEAPIHSQVQITIAGESGNDWTIQKKEDEWTFAEPMPKRIAATVTIPAEIAWKLLSKSLHGESARSHIRIEGDERLGRPVTKLVSVMA